MRELGARVGITELSMHLNDLEGHTCKRQIMRGGYRTRWSAVMLNKAR